NTFRPIIESQLTTTLGRSIKLGDLSLALFSGSLIAKDLVVSDDLSFDAAPFLTAKEVRIGVLLRPLIFSRKVNLQSFQFKSPEINLIRSYKSKMSKTVEQWLLFKYLGLEFTPLSKPFKTREQAERASENTPAGALFIPANGKWNSSSIARLHAGDAEAAS